MYAISSHFKTKDMKCAIVAMFKIRETNTVFYKCNSHLSIKTFKKHLQLILSLHCIITHFQTVYCKNYIKLIAYFF